MTPTHAIHGSTDRICVRHTKRLKAGEVCPLCGPAKGASVAVAKRPKAGSDTEALLASQLVAAGYFDATFDERPNAIGRDLCFRREVPWGLALEPERGFRFDVAFLYHRLGVEIKGLAHAAGRKKVKADVEREGLAVSLGWRVLPLTPEQVRDGSAVALIARALNPSKEASS